MIIGIGVDIVDIRRIEQLIERFDNHFIKRIFTPKEREYVSLRPHPVRSYANRFAAKEAASKALGTGMGEGIGWHDIEVLMASSGGPSLAFHNKAQTRFIDLVPKGYKTKSHVSFSDEPPYSTAFVILSGYI